MRTQTSLALFLPEVAPTAAHQPRPVRPKAQDAEPLLLDAPEQLDPGAERALWTKRTVLVPAWRPAWNWNLLDCAFEFDVTFPAMLAAFERFGLDVPPDPVEPTHNLPCSACGTMIQATKHVRLCTGCGGCGVPLTEIARKEAQMEARRRNRESEDVAWPAEPLAPKTSPSWAGPSSSCFPCPGPGTAPQSLWRSFSSPSPAHLLPFVLVQSHGLEAAREVGRHGAAHSLLDRSVAPGANLMASCVPGLPGWPDPDLGIWPEREQLLLAVHCVAHAPQLCPFGLTRRCSTSASACLYGRSGG